MPTQTSYFLVVTLIYVISPTFALDSGNPCIDPNPCKNLGKCQNQQGSIHCDCAIGWGGVNCTEKLRLSIDSSFCMDPKRCLRPWLICIKGDGVFSISYPDGIVQTKFQYSANGMTPWTLLNTQPESKNITSYVKYPLPTSERVTGYYRCSRTLNGDGLGISKSVYQEFGCKTCELMCDNNRCVPKAYMCDGDNDCGDWSDEKNCVCKSNEYQCANGTCVSKCDGFNDCGGLSRCDERHCGCKRSFEFKCDNGDCVNKKTMCDGRNDCGDWSDERKCGTSVTPTDNTATPGPGFCKSSELKCDNGDCVDKDKKCDKRADCEDGTDERNCNYEIKLNGQTESFSTAWTGLDCMNYFSTTPGSIVKIKFQYSANGMAPWTLLNTSTTLSSNETWFLNTHIYYMKIKRTYRLPTFQRVAGYYRCTRTINGGDLEISNSVYTTFTGCKRLDGAENYFFKCDKGDCLEKKVLCDGDNDCGDWSDEKYCVCKSSEFLCDNGLCVPEDYVCDGDNDCRDGSDERNCGSVRPTDSTTRAPGFCKSSEFRCENGYTCVPQGWECDGANDCGDWSDERNCGTTEVLVDLRIYQGLTYTSDYQDPSSEAYRELQSKILDWADRSLKALRSYRSVEIVSIREGSVVVQLQATFTGNLVSQQEVMTTLSNDLFSFPLDSAGVDVLGSTVRPTDNTTPGVCEFQCDNGNCVRQADVCDGDNDCGDWSDERYCKTTPWPTASPQPSHWPTASPQPSHCKDLKDTCVEWLYMGYCTDPDYQTYMTVYCRKSCTMCTGASAAMNNQGDPCIRVPCSSKVAWVCGSNGNSYKNDCELINARKCGKEVIIFESWGCCKHDPNCGGYSPGPYTMHPTWWGK